MLKYEILCWVLQAVGVRVYSSKEGLDVGEQIEIGIFTTVSASPQTARSRVWEH